MKTLYTTLAIALVSFISCNNLKQNTYQLEFSTFLGPVRSGQVFHKPNVATDKDGFIYVTGPMMAKGFPKTKLAHDTVFAGSKTYIAKFTPDGKELVYCTYIGKHMKRTAVMPYDICVDNKGCAYIAGGTGSPIFPVTDNAFDTSYNGGQWGDGFILKINADGSKIEYASYLGSSGSDEIWELFVDNHGRAYVMGGCIGNDFPVTPNAFDTTYDGGHQWGDGFIARFSADGSKLDFCTYIGGSGDDAPWGMTVDDSGNIYIGGATKSHDYPTTPGAVSTDTIGGGDVGITKFDSTCSKLIYSTYLGGSKGDNGCRLAVDIEGNLIFAMNTQSPDFPVTANAFDNSFNGKKDVALVILNTDGTELVYSSFLGGAEDDDLGDFFFDSKGIAFISSVSKSNNYPVTYNFLNDSLNGNQDVVLSIFEPPYTQLSYSGYFGGNKEETSTDISVFNDKIIVAGVTQSEDFPIKNAWQNTYSNKGKGKGGGDVFILGLIK